MCVMYTVYLLTYTCYNVCFDVVCDIINFYCRISLNAHVRMSHRWEIVTKDYDVGFGLYYKPMGQTERLHAGDMEAKVCIDLESN